MISLYIVVFWLYFDVLTYPARKTGVRKVGCKDVRRRDGEILF